MGNLWPFPQLQNVLGIRESDGALLLTGGVVLTPTALANIAGEADQFVPASGKVLTLSNSLTLAGTDSTVITFPSTSATVARTDAAQTFTGAQTFGTMPIIPTAPVAATGNDQAGAAPITTGFTLVSGADDTKGVKLPTAVAGLVCIVKSSVADKILKVYPFSGDAINAIAANSAISLASGPTIAAFIAYDATTWYTLPLLPS